LGSVGVCLDMTHVYVGSDPQDMTVRLYAITEAGSPQPLRELELGGPVAACHALDTPQGRVVAWTGWFPRGRLLNLRTGKETETTNIGADRVNSMRVLASYRLQAGGEGEGEAEAEARLVAGRFDGNVGIFDVRSGACLRVLGDAHPHGGVSEVLSLAVYYTNDGAPRLVSAGSGSRMASIWDPEDGRRLHDWQAAEASSIHIRAFGECGAGAGGGGGEGPVAQLASCSMGENQLRVWAVGGVWPLHLRGHHAWGVTACRLLPPLQVGPDDTTSLLWSVTLARPAFMLAPFVCAGTGRWLAAVALQARSPGTAEFQVGIGPSVSAQSSGSCSKLSTTDSTRLLPCVAPFPACGAPDDRPGGWGLGRHGGGGRALGPRLEYGRHTAAGRGQVADGGALRGQVPRLRHRR
jgi:hypothetical protein